MCHFPRLYHTILMTEARGDRGMILLKIRFANLSTSFQVFNIKACYKEKLQDDVYHHFNFLNTRMPPIWPQAI